MSSMQDTSEGRAVMKPKIAILASGNGSTAETFIRASVAGEVNGEVGLVICNNPEAGILKRIANLNQEFGLHVATRIINSSTHPAVDGLAVAKGSQTGPEETAILQTLQGGNFDLIVLTGYMKRVGPGIISAYGWRPEYTSPYQAMLLNTHPGLLPESIGLYGIHIQEHVLEKGLRESGHTVHVVSENYDEGPTVFENKVAVLPDDTAESLFARVQGLEKVRLPANIEAFLKARGRYLISRNPTSDIVKA